MSNTNPSAPLGDEEIETKRAIATNAETRGRIGDAWKKFVIAFRPFECLRLFATLDAERAARERVERERDELREAVKWWHKQLDHTDMWDRFATEAFGDGEGQKHAAAFVRIVDAEFAAYEKADTR
jgi:hypothetical protein